MTQAPAPDSALDGARAAYRRRDWRTARDAYEAVRRTHELDADDLARLGDCAWWLGSVAESLAATEEAHHAYLSRGDVATAATYALDLGFVWSMRGDGAIGSGWISRARRLLADQPPGPAHGLLRYVDVSADLSADRTDRALAGAGELQEMGRRYQTPTLTALGLVVEGLVRIRRGGVTEGFRLLDEAMLPVLGAQVRPDWAGSVYCSTMLVCHQLADLRRAREWCRAAEQWCAQFSDAVMFQGICRLHRVQLLHSEGAWSEAEREVDRVCRELEDINVAVVAEGEYQRGEIHRVRGEHAEARAAYQRASELGGETEPGWSLLLLAEGRSDEAWSSVNASLGRAGEDPFTLVRLLRAHVEIALATGHAGPAERSARELAGLTATYDSPGFAAWSRHARGAVLLAQGRHDEALTELRSACHAYQTLGVPYEVARVEMLLAEAFHATGEEDLARAAEQSARATFGRLGVVRPDSAHLPAGLTQRESEVLAHVARGASNRDVAAALTISEKTVGRHLANIFMKLGVSSRTAAAAWAHEHGLSASFAPSPARRAP